MTSSHPDSFVPFVETGSLDFVVVLGAGPEVAVDPGPVADDTVGLGTRRWGGAFQIV